MKELIFRSETSSLIYYPELHYIEMCIAGTVPTKDYKSTWNNLLNYEIKHKVLRWLIDLKLQVVEPKALDWSEKEWLPLSYQKLGSRRRLAVILPQNLISNYRAKQIVTRAQQDHSVFVEIDFFKQNDAALSWLLSNKVSSLN